MEVTGKIKVLKETQEIGSNGFRKREVVITTDETYPQHLLIEFTQDRCELLTDFKIGDTITIAIDIRGREWQSPSGEIRYFNSLNGWKINNGKGEATPPPPPLVENDNDSSIPF